MDEPVACDAARVADTQRRFGGVARLYGAAGAQRIGQSHAVVVGVGGVGSWAVEALARCGVARLTLIDLDHVAESNINRQVQALDSTLGLAKVEALRRRIGDIHPQAQVQTIEEFVDASNVEALVPANADVVLDCCDQIGAKTALAALALQRRQPLLMAGAAGGKRQPERLRLTDLGRLTHDPLLAKVRYRLRRHHAAPRSGAIGIVCAHSEEAVATPAGADPGAGLHCAGYGSSVMVTAAMGMLLAARAIERIVQPGAQRLAC